MNSRPDDPSAPPPGCPAHAGSGATSLHGKAFSMDAHAVYAELRRQGPAAPVELAPGVDAMLVTSHAAALHVLHSPEVFAKDPRRWRALADGTVPADSPVVPMMMYRPNCLFTDGSEHLRLRQAVTDSLNRIDPYELRRFVESSSDYLIDQWGDSGSVDLLHGYAKTLPLLVFSRLFGSPAELGDRLVAGISGIFEGVDAENANAVLTGALVELVALKRAHPGPDVTSWLMAHPNRLNDEEMIHQLVMLMSAGTEPQRNLIANGLRLILSDERFSASLFGAGGSVEDALEEVLWTDPPMANYAVHYPVRDVDLSGVAVRQGTPVVISFAAANTDPTLFAHGQRPSNRSHLAWSAGPHACPAKDSAWLIATAAIEKLLNRLPDLELAIPVQELDWRPGPFHRALNALPARYTPVLTHRAASTPPPVPTAAPRVAAGPADRGEEVRKPGVWSSFLNWWRNQ
ncbi:cytochrome P450 [Embleya sp. NBC_00888]|uniref:cytochrome P450 n=1 Tax=Embleya sp. NBC_00888 TaxID=2975960 RepID=UPI00386B77E0